MKRIFKNIGLVILMILSGSCTNEKLNGHFHLEWGNGDQFQIWNIKNNKMVINRNVCPDESNNCFSSQISFKRGKMYVEPWVDSDYDCEYSIDKNGTITMKNENRIMKLVPHSGCQSNGDYFSRKTKKYSKSFQFVEESMTGKSVLPSKNENELIVIYKKQDEESILLFNGKNIQSLAEIKKTKKETVWLHIDKRIKLSEVIPILKSLDQKGYKCYFSALSKGENNEQIQLLSRNIESISEVDNRFEIELCEFCEKHSVSQVDSIIKIEIIEPEKYFIQGDTVSLHQTRIRIAQYLGKNRTSRLKTQIQFIIPEQTNFETYFRLIDEVNFIHIELSEITNYKGENDIDMKAIRNNGLDKKKEFPIRIKEIIKKENS